MTTLIHIPTGQACELLSEDGDYVRVHLAGKPQTRKRSEFRRAKAPNTSPGEIIRIVIRDRGSPVLEAEVIDSNTVRVLTTPAIDARGYDWAKAYGGATLEKKNWKRVR